MLDEPDNRLTEVLAAYDAGERDRMRSLLDEFIIDYPEHPFSRRLRTTSP